MPNRVTKSLRKLFRWGPNTKGPKDAGMSGGRRSRRSNYDVYNDALKTPRDRTKLYDLYDELDEIPEVASVLDAYAEDATQIDKQRQSSVWIEGKNKEVVDELNKLFKRIEVEEFIEGLARDVSKYGDDFARLIFHDPEQSDDKKTHLGVMGLQWYDPREVERVEEENGVLLGFMETDKLGGNQIRDEDMFNPWDFVHFRIRTRKYISRSGGNVYGTSLLRNASRSGKQYKMIDDMLLVLRMTKSTDKRIYNIDVGNAAPAEIPGILRNYQSIFTRAHWRDYISGEVSELYDPLAMDEDIFWPKRKGSETEVKVIPAEPNISSLADVDHKRNQLFGSLRAPKAHFGFEGDVDARNTISSQDIRFARLVKKLQRSIINGLVRLCQIHLALREMPTEKENFKVVMLEASAIEHVQRLEADQILIDMAERMVVMGESMALDPIQWRMHILRKIFGFTETDLKKYFRVALVKQAEVPIINPEGGKQDTGEDAYPTPHAAKSPEPEAPRESTTDHHQMMEDIMQTVLARKADMVGEGAEGERDQPVPGAPKRKPPRIDIAGVIYELKEDGKYNKVEDAAAPAA
jgi:hypothetical protein